MVTFCIGCGASLPLADVVFRDGVEMTAPDFDCPACHEPAGAERPHPEEGVIPDEENDVLIVDGAEAHVPVDTESSTVEAQAGASSKPEPEPVAEAPPESPPPEPAVPDVSIEDPLPSPFDS